MATQATTQNIFPNNPARYASYQTDNQAILAWFIEAVWTPKWNSMFHYDTSTGKERYKKVIATLEALRNLPAVLQGEPYARVLESGTNSVFFCKHGDNIVVYHFAPFDPNGNRMNNKITIIKEIPLAEFYAIWEQWIGLAIKEYYEAFAITRNGGEAPYTFADRAVHKGMKVSPRLIV